MKLFWRLSFAITFAITSVSLLYFTQVRPLWSWSLSLNDIWFSVNDKKPNEQVVFVAVDEKSVNQLGRWPWNRNIVAQGLAPLHEAKVITLDMVFSEPIIDNKGSKADAKLAKTLSSLGNVVCGFFLRAQATQETPLSARQVLADSSLERITLPTGSFFETTFAEVNIEPLLSSCALHATFSTVPDDDGLFRRYPNGYIFDKRVYPSLGIQSLRLFMNEDVTITGNTSTITTTFEGTKQTFSSDKHGFVRLNYYPLHTYHMLSFIDVLEGKIAPSFFKDKIVIVGISEAGVTDIRATPLGQIPGPLLHYTFISNIFDNSLLRTTPYATYSIIFLVGLLVWGGGIKIKRLIIRSTAYLLYVLAIITLGYGGYRFYNTVYDIFYPLLTLMISILAIEYIIFKHEEKSNAYIKNAFSSYLSPSLLGQLLQHPDKLTLGGEEKELTIFFSDIRGFTTLSEKLASPTHLVSLLNRYFTPMTQIIVNHGGMVDKYIGDAIMAFFNAPVDLLHHPDIACQACLDMQEALAKLNIQLSTEGLPPITIGMGVNTATVVVGNMGSQTRFNYTVMGDGVNLASRLEGLNKIYGTHILISEFTKNKLTQHFLLRPLEPVIVKGKSQAVMIYELLSDTDENRMLIEEFTTAINYCQKKETREQGLTILQQRGACDTVSEYFYQKYIRLN